MKYLIKLQNSLYYVDGNYCWTSDLNKAKQWDDQATPQKIVEYWNKVHYKDDPKKGSTALCGQCVLNAEVVTLDI